MDTTDNTLTDGTEGSGLFLAHVLFGPTTDPLTQLQNRLEKAGFTVHVSQDRKFGGWGTLQSGNALELTLDDETTAFFSFVNAAIPAQEAETVAENNYRWPDAHAAVAKHTAYVNVALQHRGAHRLEAAKTFVKMIVTTLNHRSAIGVYFNATVYEKKITSCATKKRSQRIRRPFPLKTWSGWD